MINVRKIMLKIIIISIIISIFGICVPSNYSNASEFRTVFEYAAGMKGNVSSEIDTGPLSKIIGRVVGAIQIISGLFAVITISFTGFEYVLYQTPDMKSQLKKKMLPVIIALVLIFGAVSIAQFLIAAFE